MKTVRREKAMEYEIKALSRLAGVTTRTLRYYEKMGLLQSARKENGYRVYDKKAVDRLQKILFYREMGLSLLEIKSILASEGIHEKEKLTCCLARLETEKTRLESLITNLKKTIFTLEGEEEMTDAEKFYGFKKEKLDANEKQYGEELKKKYGEETMKKSNQKFLALSKEEYHTMEETSEKILELLCEAVINKEDPAGEAGKRIYELHRQFLSFSLPSYDKRVHIGICEMYLADERFLRYYDKKKNIGN